MVVNGRNMKALSNRYISFSRRLSKRLLIVFQITITVVSVIIIALAAIGVKAMSTAYFMAELQIANEAIERLVTDSASTQKMYKQFKKIDKKINKLYPLVPESTNKVDNKDLWAYSIIIDSVGNYIVHPDKQRMQKGNFFEDVKETDEVRYKELVEGLAIGKKRVQAIIINGSSSYIFYAKVKSTNWRNAIILPKNGLLMPMLQIGVLLLVIIGLGLFAAYYISRFTIHRSTLPLSQLAQSADEVAKGNFQAQLPELKHNDEIRHLRDSFSNMQQSLVKYIDELKETTASKAAIENELKVAHQIQMSMVPRTFPPFPNRSDIDLYASMTPAKEVGGDLYDYFIQNEVLYFCVGDVSGKGIPASLFMAVTRNLFRIIAQQGHKPEQIATQMNAVLSNDNDRTMFVTMFIGMADLKTGHLDFCNCGHNPPVFDGEFMKLEHANQPLGLWEDDIFTGDSLDDIRGRKLLLYTDGLNEAEDTAHKQLGNKSVADIMTAAASESSREVIEKMIVAVEKHRNGAEPNDDLTLLCLELK